MVVFYTCKNKAWLARVNGCVSLIKGLLGNSESDLLLLA